MLLILKQLFKYWFFAALIIIPLSLIISYITLRDGGLSGSEIYLTLVTKIFIGNIGTTLFFGYVWMKANKASWSYSAQEKKAL